MAYVVIGAGIVGASAAYALARSGTEVTLVDRTHEGQATAAGAGIVVAATTRGVPPSWFPLAFAAIDYYPTLLSHLSDDGETDTGYEVVGELFAARDEAEAVRLRDMQNQVEARKAAGVGNIGEVSLLSPDEARSLFPALRPGMPALHLSGAARVNGRTLRDALVRAAVKRGTAVVRGEATVRRTSGGVNGVEVDGHVISADAIILAGGAWSRGTAAEAGVDLQVFPQRGQIVHLEMPGAGAGRWPIVSGFGSHYMLTFPVSRVVAGATRETGSGFDYRITVGGQFEVLQQALDVAPGLSTATLVETRVGFRPASPDRLPLLGETSMPGLVVATGLGPSGLTMGPYLGELAAGIALGRSAPLDLAPYAPGRFNSAR